MAEGNRLAKSQPRTPPGAVAEALSRSGRPGCGRRLHHAELSGQERRVDPAGGGGRHTGLSGRPVTRRCTTPIGDDLRTAGRAISAWSFPFVPLSDHNPRESASEKSAWSRSFWSMTTKSFGAGIDPQRRPRTGGHRRSRLGGAGAGADTGPSAGCRRPRRTLPDGNGIELCRDCSPARRTCAV